MRKPALKTFYKIIKNIKNQRFVVSIAFIFALWQLLASNFSSSRVHLIESRDTQSYHHPLLQLSLGQKIIKYHHEQEKQSVLNLDKTTTNTTINLQDDNMFECEWSAYISTTGKKVEMCVHPFNDIVSNSVRHSHRWGDCNILPKHWRSNAGDKSIYVEIGANIGTCVLEMLLSTDAPMIAFEPNPRNFFALSNTIQRLDESYKKRVVLIPVALGDKSGTNKLYAASDNMGNSVVGKVIKDFNNQVFSKGDQFDIQIERIDNILNPNVEIALMKMDAQGYECKIVQGFGKLSTKVKHIHFEIASRWQKEHDCFNLCQILRDFGFEIYDKRGVILQGEGPGGDVTFDADAVKKPIVNKK